MLKAEIEALKTSFNPIPSQIQTLQNDVTSSKAEMPKVIEDIEDMKTEALLQNIKTDRNFDSLFERFEKVMSHLGIANNEQHPHPPTSQPTKTLPHIKALPSYNPLPSPNVKSR